MMKATLAGLAMVAGMPALHAETLYVSNERGNSISVIDAATMMPLATWPVGGRPRGITLSLDGKYILLCASSDHAVQLIDRATGKIIADLPSGQDPEQFFLSRDGRMLFVANEDDAALTAIDLESRTVAFQVDVGKEPEGVAQSPDGRWVVVTSEEDNVVNWIDLTTRTMVDATETDQRPRHVEFTADGTQLWIAAEIGGTVQIADPHTRKITAAIRFAIAGVQDHLILPCGIRFTPDGKTAIVALGRANHIALVDVATRTVRAMCPWANGCGTSPSARMARALMQPMACPIACRSWTSPVRRSSARCRWALARGGSPSRHDLPAPLTQGTRTKVQFAPRPTRRTLSPVGTTGA